MKTPNIINLSLNVGIKVEMDWSQPQSSCNCGSVSNLSPIVRCLYSLWMLQIIRFHKKQHDCDLLLAVATHGWKPNIVCPLLTLILCLTTDEDSLNQFLLKEPSEARLPAAIHLIWWLHQWSVGWDVSDISVERILHYVLHMKLRCWWLSWGPYLHCGPSRTQTNQ